MDWMHKQWDPGLNSGRISTDKRKWGSRWHREMNIEFGSKGVFEEENEEAGEWEQIQRSQFGPSQFSPPKLIVHTLGLINQ